MAKKNKVRADRVIILVLLVILLAGLLVYGVLLIKDKVSTKSTTDTTTSSSTVITNPDPVETTAGIKVTQGDYDVYIDDTDKLGFNFVLATLTFNSDSAVSFDLGNLKTSQKIALNDVSSYLQKLEDAGYQTSKLGYVSSVSSTENEYTCKVFIPYTTTDSSLRVTNAVDASMLTYDLDHNIKYYSSLKIDEISSGKTVDVDNTSITIADSYVSTMMLCNGEEYDVASTRSVYTFEINVNEIEGNVMITDAYFVPDGSSAQIPCMTSEYSCVKADNALGKKLVLGNNGALFFETQTLSSNTQGTLWLTLSNKPGELVKVSTSME